MNRSKIDWTDYTWNPVTGCLNDCPYCFARRQAKRFGGDVRKNIAQYSGDQPPFILEEPYAAENKRTLSFPFGFAPTFHRYRLGWPEKLKNSQNVFVCSMGDLLGPWIPSYWICQVLDACLRADWHNYMFLTKYPERYQVLNHLAMLPQGHNYWYGTTVTCSDEIKRIDNLPDAGGRFISLEPLHSPIDLSCSKLDWVIVGAETGNRREKILPEKSWIEDIAKQCCDMGIPVFMKESIRELMGEIFQQNFPKELTHKPISAKLQQKLHSDCGFCKKTLCKKDMTAILMRTARGKSAYSMGYLCQDCMNSLEKQMKGAFSGFISNGGDL